MKQLLSLIPRNLREITPYISPHILRLVNVREALTKAVKAIKSDQKTVANLKREIEPFLPGHLTLAGDKPLSGRSITELNQDEKETVGDLILALYFSQLRCQSGLFLDMRFAQFEFDGSSLHWQPKRFAYSFSTDFREGLCDVYHGFYTENPNLFDAGFQRLGLLPEGAPQSEKQQIRELMFEHFGSNVENQNFTMEHFRATFHQIFSFLVEKKYRIPADFVLFGFYLITLYMSLESLGQKHNVKAIYNKNLGSHLENCA